MIKKKGKKTNNKGMRGRKIERGVKLPHLLATDWR